MSDEGTAHHPRMVEIFMFENRRGEHVVQVVNRRTGAKRRAIVAYPERSPFSASCEILKHLLEELGHE